MQNQHSLNKLSAEGHTILDLDASFYRSSDSNRWVLGSLSIKPAFKLTFWELQEIENQCNHALFFRYQNLTSKPEQPHRLSFFNRLCLMISFWYIRCNLFLNVICNSKSPLSLQVGFWELGSHIVIPQSMSSRRGNWAVANWIPPERSKKNKIINKSLLQDQSMLQI